MPDPEEDVTPFEIEHKYPSWLKTTLDGDGNFLEIQSAQCINTEIAGTLYSGKCPSGPCIENFPYTASVRCIWFVAEEGETPAHCSNPTPGTLYSGTCPDGACAEITPYSPIPYCKWFSAPDEDNKDNLVNRKHVCQIINTIQSNYKTTGGDECQQDGYIKPPAWGTRSNICEFADPINNKCTREECSLDNEIRFIGSGIGTFGSYSAKGIWGIKGEAKTGIELTNEDKLAHLAPFKTRYAGYKWEEINLGDYSVPSSYTPAEEQETYLITIKLGTVADLYASKIRIYFSSVHVNGTIRVNTNRAAVKYLGYSGSKANPLGSVTTIDLPLSAVNPIPVTIEIQSAGNKETIIVDDKEQEVAFSGLIIDKIELYRPSTFDYDVIGYETEDGDDFYAATGSRFVKIDGTIVSNFATIDGKCFAGNYSIGKMVKDLSIDDGAVYTSNCFCIPEGLGYLQKVDLSDGWGVRVGDSDNEIPYKTFYNPINMRSFMCYKSTNTNLGGYADISTPDTANLTFVKHDGSTETLNDCRIIYYPINSLQYNNILTRFSGSVSSYGEEGTDSSVGENDARTNTTSATTVSTDDQQVFADIVTTTEEILNSFKSTFSYLYT